MRSLALFALGSFVASTTLVAQSLTEHAAAAAGATIGTAAGKPLGTALGNVFGNVDKSASKAATTGKPAKPSNPPVTKPVPPPEPTTPVATVGLAPSSGGVGAGDVGGGGGGGSSAHHSAHHREAPVPTEPVAAAPILPVIPAEPAVKEPTVEQVASIKVGATASEMRAVLGAPESQVSIPGDDGHMLETCQYWAKGEQIGTIHLDNGRVISVQTAN